MLKPTRSLKMPTLITIKANNIKVIGKSNLKPSFSKLKKTKITQSKSPTVLSNIKITRFITFKTRIAFIQLRKTFIKVLNLQYFDLEYLIRIEINVLSYAIGIILSLLTLD